ncbi:hypothetical protein [Luteimicrobium subarcticum]|nr:hypothetical protein [Luteimicrobium subarcticum]
MTQIPLATATRWSVGMTMHFVRPDPRQPSRERRKSGATRTSALCIALAATLAACSSGDQQAAGDSPFYASLGALESASDHALLISVTGIEKAVIEGMDQDIVHADVEASDPDFDHKTVTLTLPVDNGTDDSVELRTGTEYAVFVKVSDSGVAYLTSPDQGVFPVVDGTAGHSDAGTFPLGDAARRLGLAG